MDISLICAYELKGINIKENRKMTKRVRKFFNREEVIYSRLNKYSVKRKKRSVI